MYRITGGDMKVWGLFMAGVMCTMFAGNKNLSYCDSDCPLPKTRQGIVSSSLDGHLLCCVTYNPRDNSYKGVVINQNYEPAHWILKNLDENLARKYYEKLGRINRNM